MSTEARVSTENPVATQARADELEAIEWAGPIRRFVTVWYAVAGGIGAWTVHLLFEAAFVKFTCTSHGWVWAMHLVTAVTALATVAAMALAWRLLRISRDADEAAADAGGRLQFLGYAGLLIGAINLALILLEGADVVFLHRCG
jgi:hypothetical protein